MPGFGRAASAQEVSWSELPEEILVSQIVAGLPLPSLLRSRAVCREWKKAVESSRERMLVVVGFLCHPDLDFGSDLDWKSVYDLAWCVYDLAWCVYDLAWCVYDRCFDRWYKLQPPPWLRGPEGGLASLLPATGAGGLLLSVSCPWSAEREWDGRNPHLGNPVAGSWTTLPKFPVVIGLDDLRGMWVDAEARCFKLVAVELDGRWLPSFMDDPIRTWVFDSALGTWSVTTCALRAPEIGALKP